MVHSGARGIHFEPDGWAGLYFHHPSLINTASYSGLDFWIHGGTSGNQDVEVRLFNGDQEVGSAEISELLGAPIAAGQWRHVVMPFSSLGISGSFNDIFFQDASGQNQARVYLDDIQLAPK